MASSAAQAVERSAVAHRRGHCHDSCAGQAAHHAGQRALHPGDHHEGVRLIETLMHDQWSVQPRDPHIGDQLR